MSILTRENVNEESENVEVPFPRHSAFSTRRFLKPDQFAEYLGIPLRWIYRHIKDIPHHRIGKYLRFDLESPALRQWIQNLERPPQQ